MEKELEMKYKQVSKQINSPMRNLKIRIRQHLRRNLQEPPRIMNQSSNPMSNFYKQLPKKPNAKRISKKKKKSNTKKKLFERKKPRKDRPKTYHEQHTRNLRSANEKRDLIVYELSHQPVNCDECNVTGASRCNKWSPQTFTWSWRVRRFCWRIQHQTKPKTNTIKNHIIGPKNALIYHVKKWPQRRKCFWKAHKPKSSNSKRKSSRWRETLTIISIQKLRKHLKTSSTTTKISNGKLKAPSSHSSIGRLHIPPRIYYSRKSERIHSNYNLDQIHGRELGTTSSQNQFLTHLTCQMSHNQ